MLQILAERNGTYRRERVQGFGIIVTNRRQYEQEM